MYTISGKNIFALEQPLTVQRASKMFIKLSYMAIGRKYPFIINLACKHNENIRLISKTNLFGQKTIIFNHSPSIEHLHVSIKPPWQNLQVRPKRTKTTSIILKSSKSMLYTNKSTKNIHNISIHQLNLLGWFQKWGPEGRN